MHLPGNIINLEALLYTLSQQSSPLPESLQASLTEIGRVLQIDPSKENVDRLRQVIKADEPFETAYQQGLVEIDHQYTSQERTKGVGMMGGANFSNATELKDLDLNAFLTSYDWVNVAKIAINRKRSQPKRSQFLLRGDRVVTLAGGGAFLGVLIFQIPGAIVGGLLAGIYAWLSFPTAKANGSN